MAKFASTRKKALLLVPVYSPEIIQSKYYEKHVLLSEAVIFDFEDSLPHGLRESGQATTRALVEKFKNSDVKMIVRINNMFATEDISFVNSIEQIKYVILPKIENELVYEAYVRSLRDDIQVLPVIETAYSVIFAEKIFASTLGRIAAFIFGSEDLTAELGIWPENYNLFYAAQRSILISKLYKKPIYGTQGKFTGYAGEDLVEFEKNLDISKRIGFDGCFAIHPKQINVIDRVFNLTNEQLKNYESILRKENSDKKVQTLEDGMIGPPTFKRIKKLLGS